ncbi:hypothetical protein KC318_g324 [Hortaea werneckii]|nr:hypothetical protein KC334_g351 [Hortaea werneckii]KAI7027535.1 hypothetical protein KC355_g297 [Hortaea werneckii]KAI7205362.1 hypothetical protein KC324_g324 [Hortaea werneckii]KAI7595826.1 hypothetical protein KC316_g283 [Hortaea werneckii]KAI7676355.1 hypothetical protein KC318_g324 [Hortaea werneckii]
MPAERSGPGSGKPRSSCTQCRKRKQRVEYGPAIIVQSVPSAIFANLTLENVQRYWGGLDHFNLSQLTREASAQHEPIESLLSETVLRKAVNQLPNRTLTDALVQSYLQNDNMQYYSIHPQTFLREYDAWWAARMGNQSLSVSWTALLLQVCANAVKGLEPNLRQRLQYDLAETDESASLRFFDAARCVGGTLTPGAGGLCRVTQLLLAAAWLKAGGQIVEGWHALSIAVRDAQECGINHDGANRSRYNEIQVELRRRTWSYIVVWDWQMAEWLSQPMLTEGQMNTPSPNPLVDECGSGQPSPVLSLGEQFKLVRLLSTRFGPLTGITDDNGSLEVVDAIDKWVRQLPKELHLSSGSYNRDESPYWLICQRLSLHCFAYMARLIPLKRILTAKSNAATHRQVKRMDLLRLAVQLCIECMDMGIALHRAMHPLRANFHFVIFVLFDTATVICSALMHDPDHELPERPRLLQKVQEALGALETLMQHAHSAKRGAEVLRLLMKEVGSISHDESVPGYVDSRMQYGACPPTQATCATTEPSMGTAPPSPEPPSDLRVPSDTAAINPVCKNNTAFPIEDTPNVFPAQDLGIEGILDLDLGGLESIWDWEGLGLTDAF